MTRLRNLTGMLALVVLASACDLVTPSDPFSPATVSSPGPGVFVATTGCERRVSAIELVTAEETFWRLESEDPVGIDIATVTIGDIPSGFVETTSLNSEWVDAELFGRSGAAIVFRGVEAVSDIESMGVFVPSEGSFGWLFGDSDDVPGENWETYVEFVSDSGEVGGWACDSVIAEPGA